MAIPPIPRHGQLRAQGGYSDIYYDAYIEYADGLYLITRKNFRYTLTTEGYVPVTSTFEFAADLQETDDSIWAAISATWANRGDYATIDDLKTAMNAALTAAGFTAPGGLPL